MSFDPNQFTMQLIQGIGQQIQQGRQRSEENQVLEQLIPQLQQAQTPEDALNFIAELQTSGLPQQRTQQLTDVAKLFAEQSQTQQSREGLINIAERTTGIPREDLAKLDNTSLRQVATRGLTGGASPGPGAINIQDPEQATKDLKDVYGVSDAEARTFLASNRGVRTKLIDSWIRDIDRGLRQAGPRFGEAQELSSGLVEVDPRRTPTIDPVNITGELPSENLFRLDEKDFISSLNDASRTFQVDLPAWPSGMSQAEISRERKENLKENRTEAKEINENINFLKAEGRDLNSLDRINKTGDLPDTAAKLFQVDTTRGNVRPVATAFKAVSPAAELYSKILNGFIRKARDFFGARVTNFELGAFLSTLPTLLNSAEGRDLVNQQMRLVNRINRIEQKIRQTLLSKAQGRFTSLELQPEIDKILVEQNQGLIDELNRVVDRSQTIAQTGVQQEQPERTEQQQSVDQILFGDL